jgi:hypothetical protein
MGKQRTRRTQPFEKRFSQAPRRNGKLAFSSIESDSSRHEHRGLAYELPPIPNDLGEGMRAFDIEKGEWRAVKLIRPR